MGRQAAREAAAGYARSARQGAAAPEQPSARAATRSAPQHQLQLQRRSRVGPPGCAPRRATHTHKQKKGIGAHRGHSLVGPLPPEAAAPPLGLALLEGHAPLRHQHVAGGDKGGGGGAACRRAGEGREDGACDCSQGGWVGWAAGPYLLAGARECGCGRCGRTCGGALAWARQRACARAGGCRGARRWGRRTGSAAQRAQAQAHPQERRRATPPCCAGPPDTPCVRPSSPSWEARTRRRPHRLQGRVDAGRCRGGGR